MTVAVSGNVFDVLGRLDVRPWKVWAGSYRAGPAGSVITTRAQVIYPADGVFTAELEPGAAVFEAPDGLRWNVTVPDDDAELGAVLDAGVQV